MRLIDADTLVHEINKDFHDQKIDCLIHAAPTVDAAPVVHGHWGKSEDDYCGLNIYQCSVCHEEWCFEIDDDVKDLNYHYCPNCGARMDGERRSGDA